MPNIICMSSVGKIFYHRVYINRSFVNHKYVILTGVLVNFLQGPAIISVKSIINKIIPAAELG